MNARIQAARLPDGRLHLNDGPIDLVIWCEGTDAPRAQAAAIERFETILDELCAELPLLRTEAQPDGARPSGSTAARMAKAVAPVCRDRFITPMAAVAGAVADEILAAMTAAADLRRAYVNNGGDIAIHVATGELRIGLIDRPDRPSLLGSATIAAGDRVGGVATSGRGGRSFSLGIADAATVLAPDAAAADAAATLIANAVDLPGHPAILRAPASALDPQSDLGARLVTRKVGALCAADVARALDAGEAEARRLEAAGAITAAALHLRGETRVVGVAKALRIAGGGAAAA